MATKRKNPLPPRYDIQDLQDGNWQTVGSVRAYSAKSAVATYRAQHAEWTKGRKLRARLPKENSGTKRKNPPAQASKAYADFHGRQPREVVENKKQVHYHKHLGGAGELKKLVVKAQRGGARVSLTGFKAALLAFNEKGTQLYVVGGDQSLDLKQFSIRDPHEAEVLGEVLSVEYFTRKDHLRPEDGGTAIYHHTFKSPRPTLAYDVVNKQLTFEGGSYKIQPEGIVQ